MRNRDDRDRSKTKTYENYKIEGKRERKDFEEYIYILDGEERTKNDTEMEERRLATESIIPLFLLFLFLFFIDNDAS